MKLSHALRLGSQEMIALVGGGGKTTAMFRLAAELAETRPVLLTTTTRLCPGQIQQAPAHLTFDPAQHTLADILPLLQQAAKTYGQVLLVGYTEPEIDKAFGVPAETINRLADHFDIIINEADGSRMRSFKAPARFEPVIPRRTTVVIPVVGLDILGQPLTDATVHRANLVGEITGLLPGSPVTEETILAVACHPQGWLKHLPETARLVPLLNKADTPARRRAARSLAARLLACDRIDSVLIGAMQAEEPVSLVYSRVAAVVLAAGGSSRFGSPKQLARWQGQTFIERVVDTALASEAEPVMVTLGAEVEQCQALLADKPIQVVVSEDWAEGQSVSMRDGLAALPPNTGAAVFLLVDLPGVTPAIVDTLIERHRQNLPPLIWPEFEGRRGNPVLFDQALFAELAQITGDTGGRPLLLAYEDRAERVAVDEEAILQDFDRPEDLAAATANDD